MLALKEILEDIEAERLTAESGNAALTLVTQHDFALVLLDVQMPGMDGFEVASLIRGVERTKHMPIIFITGSDPTSAQKMVPGDDPRVRLLFKPLDNEKLLATISELVS